jgi:hypothetical protein
MQIQLVQPMSIIEALSASLVHAALYGYVPILDTEKIAFDEGFVANSQSSATCQDLEPVIVADAPGPFDMNRSAQVQ